MALFKTSDLRARASRSTMHKTAGILLEERVIAQARVPQHDIFMSHAFNDKDLVLGAALTLEDMGYSVYLDWRDDPTLNRTVITTSTAEKLRQRMRSSKCLFYATTESASVSKWMPWELGFKDGQNSKVAILPFSDSLQVDYKGQEYLGIYPYASLSLNRLVISRDILNSVTFEQWLQRMNP